MKRRSILSKILNNYSLESFNYSMSSHIKLFSPPKKEKKKERKKKESYETQLRTEVIDIRW